MSEPKFPEVTVKLTGTSGNAFALISRVLYAMSRAGISKEDIDDFQSEAMSGDYDHVLQTCMKTVNVE